MPPNVNRTYASRSQKPSAPSSPPSALSSSPLSAPSKRARPLDDHPAFKNTPPPKRLKTSGTRKTKAKGLKGQKNLTQLHFCIDQTILRTCPLCNLSYTKGAPDDESLHRTHCARVVRGMEWGREEEKDKIRAGVLEVASGVKLKSGKKGRIICFPADAGGKIGAKLTSLLGTINLTLSSPALTPSILRASKAYLFLLSPETHASSREKIVGCVIAQRITTAMALASPEECKLIHRPQEPTPSPSNRPEPALAPTLIAVDTDIGLFCHPMLLPTPLGIPRLFVPSTHRRQGIASKLLSAAAETFIHGCSLDPRKGEVAFTQPTGDGSAVMREWGRGGVRIYEE